MSATSVIGLATYSTRAPAGAHGHPVDGCRQDRQRQQQEGRGGHSASVTERAAIRHLGSPAVLHLTLANLACQAGALPGHDARDHRRHGFPGRHAGAQRLARPIGQGQRDRRAQGRRRRGRATARRPDQSTGAQRRERQRHPRRRAGEGRCRARCSRCGRQPRRRPERDRGREGGAQARQRLGRHPRPRPDTVPRRTRSPAGGGRPDRDRPADGVRQGVERRHAAAAGHRLGCARRHRVRRGSLRRPPVVEQRAATSS